MTKYRVEVSHLRWEYATVEVDAPCRESALSIVRERYENGELLDDLSVEWDHGDIEFVEPDQFKPSDQWQPSSPCFEVLLADDRGDLLRAYTVHFLPAHDGIGWGARPLLSERFEAEDALHAAEQCRNAHPGCDVRLCIYAGEAETEAA